MDNNAEEFRRWFSQAEDDLKAAKTSLKNFHNEWACFQSQQAAEKALKAFLLLKGRRGVVSHSIFSLLKECLAFDKSLGNLSECKALDQYYVPTRYPDGLPDGTPHEFFTQEDGEKCVSYAGKVLAAIRELSKSGKLSTG